MVCRPQRTTLVLAAALAAALAGCSVVLPAEAGRQLADANSTVVGKGGKVNSCCGQNYYSPPPPSYPDFPYSGCYYKSTGTYKIKFKSAYPSHDYTRYCFWIEAKYPDPYDWSKCRNFDLWSINFRVHIDCYDKVSDLTYNGQVLQPAWVPNLPPTKAMLQVTHGGIQWLDTQYNIARYKGEVCFTLPSYCPLDKFCKGEQCKAAFYSPPSYNLNCCPGWWTKSHWWESR